MEIFRKLLLLWAISHNIVQIVYCHTDYGINCNCSTCTQEVLDTQTALFLTCGAYITTLNELFFYSKLRACVKAAEDFPNECGPCKPCDEPEPEPEPEPEEDPLLPEIVCGAEDLSALCKAVSSLPDVVEALSRTDVKYTVFAPNNEAWANLMLIHDNLLDDKDRLTNLLLNHVEVGFNAIFAEDLVCGNLLYMANSSSRGQRTKTACSFGDSPSEGDDAKPEDGEGPTAIYQKGDENTSSKDNLPEIVVTDIKARNGVAHIINNVILQKDSL